MYVHTCMNYVTVYTTSELLSVSLFSQTLLNSGANLSLLVPFHQKAESRRFENAEFLTQPILADLI